MTEKIAEVSHDGTVNLNCTNATVNNDTAPGKSDRSRTWLRFFLFFVPVSAVPVVGEGA